MRPATCSGRRPRRQGPRTRSNKPRRSRRSCWRLQSGHAVSPFDHNRRLNQAASLDRLAEFVEVRRTVIGTDVSVLLTAADGPGATRLFSDLGALAIPFEATAAIGDTHYLVAGDGNQMSVVEAWASTPAGLQDSPRRTDGSVDANRLRQYEWHCGFLDRVRETMSRAQV